MLICYARVSTEDQNLDLQRDALRKAGCKKLFEEKESGRAGTRKLALSHLRFESVYLNRPRLARAAVWNFPAGNHRGGSSRCAD
jgi:hypothetical protein